MIFIAHSDGDTDIMKSFGLYACFLACFLMVFFAVSVAADNVNINDLTACGVSCIRAICGDPRRLRD